MRKRCILAYAQNENEGSACLSTQYDQSFAIRLQNHASRNVWKRTFWYMRPKMTQISLTPSSLITVFIVRMRKLHHWLSKMRQWRFWPDCTHVQADLNLHLAHISKVRFLTFRLMRLCTLHERKPKAWMIVRGHTGWSRFSLYVYTWRHIFARLGAYDKLVALD